jgi:hypothetical protein
VTIQATLSIPAFGVKLDLGKLQCRWDNRKKNGPWILHDKGSVKIGKGVLAKPLAAGRWTLGADPELQKEEWDAFRRVLMSLMGKAGVLSVEREGETQVRIWCREKPKKE